MVEFENITFESFLQKSIAAVSLYEKRMMTITEVRNMLKLPPLQDSDYAELGITKPGQLVDPATQGIPQAPNLVGQLMAEKQKQQQQQQGSVLDKTDPLSKARTELLNELE